MSGGVDSSLAAAMLKDKGYEVIGATMKLWDASQCDIPRDAKSCCSLKGIEDAGRVAASIGIPHYVLDMSDDFKKYVLDYFCEAYMNGRTPNPCVLCNEKLKFDLLWKKARKLGCDHIATGHYCRIFHSRRTGRYGVREAKDKTKDQSYFLFSVQQQALKHTLFPLGGFTKGQARLLAKKRGLRVHNKPGSQDICFISGDYADFITRAAKRHIGPGDIVNEQGERIGHQKGFIHYTIGQRKGLGIAHPTPLYVTGIDAVNNVIKVGGKMDAYKSEVHVKGCVWGAVSAIKRARSVRVKIRYGSPKASATITPSAKGRIIVKFNRPQLAPTPGQAAVFYDRDVVLGGGWIERAC